MRRSSKKTAVKVERRCPECVPGHSDFLRELTNGEQEKVPQTVWDQYPPGRWAVLRCRYCDSVSVFGIGAFREFKARKIGTLPPVGQWYDFSAV